jgi:hypothetical protein
MGLPRFGRAARRESYGLRQRSATMGSGTFSFDAADAQAICEAVMRPNVEVTGPKGELASL